MTFGQFWNQPNRAYRDMQAAYTAIALSFLLPALTYLLAPRYAVAQFRQLGELLGASAYPYGEESFLWRILAFGNVFTLGSLVLMMQRDVRRFPMLAPVFVILKSCSAFGYFAVYLVQLRYPVFLAVFLFDSCVMGAVLLLGRRALRSLASEQDLIPALPVRTPSWFDGA